jgi:hypothetical protein
MVGKMVSLLWSLAKDVAKLMIAFYLYQEIIKLCSPIEEVKEIKIEDNHWFGLW